MKRSEYAAFFKDTGYEVKRCWADIGTWEGLDLDWRNPNFEQDDTHPVACVSWDAAHAYVAWLTRTTGKTYRLPSLSEWKLAARGGSSAAYPWGDAFDYDKANLDSYAFKDLWREDSRDQWVFTSPAGSFEPNGFGLFDVVGNLAEMLEDCAAYEDDLKETPMPTDGTPWVPSKCRFHITAGASWREAPEWAKVGSSCDAVAEDDVGNIWIGLRVVQSLD